jgi:hypothetical protein
MLLDVDLSFFSYFVPPLPFPIQVSTSRWGKEAEAFLGLAWNPQLSL